MHYHIVYNHTISSFLLSFFTILPPTFSSYIIMELRAFCLSFFAIRLLLLAVISVFFTWKLYNRTIRPESCTCTQTNIFSKYFKVYTDNLDCSLRDENTLILFIRPFEKRSYYVIPLGVRPSVCPSVLL